MLYCVYYLPFSCHQRVSFKIDCSSYGQRLNDLVHGLELQIDNATIKEALHAIESLLQNPDEEAFQNALYGLAIVLEDADIDATDAYFFGIGLMDAFGIPVPEKFPSLPEVIALVNTICK